MNVFLVIAACLVLALYIYGYFKYPRNVAILQTDIKRANTDMLLERQPVVFQDTPGLVSLKSQLFKFGFVSKFDLQASQDWIQNKFKYIAFELQSDGEVIARPPYVSAHQDTSDEHVIALQCKKGNVVILPFRWKYTTSVLTSCLGVHDLITYLIP